MISKNTTMMNILSLYKYSNSGEYNVVVPNQCHCIICRVIWDAAGKSSPYKAGACPYNDKPSAPQRLFKATDQTGKKITGKVTSWRETDTGFEVTYTPCPHEPVADREAFDLREVFQRIHNGSPERNEPRQYPYPMGPVPTMITDISAKAINDITTFYRDGIISWNEAKHRLAPFKESQEPDFTCHGVAADTLAQADITQLFKSMYAMNEQRPYVRYHEIGNRPEKSLGTGSFTWYPGDDAKPMTMFINDASWDEVMKNLAKCATDTANYTNLKENKDMSYLGYESQPAKCNETHGLTKTLEGIAKESPENAQIMKRVAENAEYERNERIEKALKGSIELTLLQGFPGKNFVLKHFRDNKEHTTYGTAYPGYDADMETAKKFEKPTVLLLSSGDPYIYGTYKALCNLIKSLEDNALPYVIKFF